MWAGQPGGGAWAPTRSPALLLLWHFGASEGPCMLGSAGMLLRCPSGIALHRPHPDARQFLVTPACYDADVQGSSHLLAQAPVTQ